MSNWIVYQNNCPMCWVQWSNSNQKISCFRFWNDEKLIYLINCFDFMQFWDLSWLLFPKNTKFLPVLGQIFCVLFRTCETVFSPRVFFAHLNLKRNLGMKDIELEVNRTWWHVKWEETSLQHSYDASKILLKKLLVLIKSNASWVICIKYNQIAIIWESIQIGLSSNSTQLKVLYYLVNNASSMKYRFHE